MNGLRSELDRRSFMYGLGASLGSVALTGLLGNDVAAHGKTLTEDNAKKPHHAAKAKSVIMLFMEGAPSHIETFDPKPKLSELHLKKFVSQNERFSGMTRGNRF